MNIWDHDKEGNVLPFVKGIMGTASLFNMGGNSFAKRRGSPLLMTFIDYLYLIVNMLKIQDTFLPISLAKLPETVIRAVYMRKVIGGVVID